MASVSATFKGLSATLFAAIATVVITVGVNNRLIAIVAVWATIALFLFLIGIIFIRKNNIGSYTKKLKMAAMNVISTCNHQNIRK